MPNYKILKNNNFRSSNIFIANLGQPSFTQLRICFIHNAVPFIGFGFLDNLSLVGTVSEEAGGFMPDILDMLEESPFLRLVSTF